MIRRKLIEQTNCPSPRRLSVKTVQRFFDCGVGFIIIALLPMLAGHDGGKDLKTSDSEIFVAAPLDPASIARNEQVARCLAIYYMRPVDADALRPWSIMHGLLAYGQDSRISSRGKLINAVEYLCSNQLGNDRRLLMVPNGRLQASIGAGVQGHPGQFLAMLAQSDVPSSQVINVEGQSFTVADLIRSEQLDCKAGTELTFRLIGLSYYLNNDAVWTNSTGEPWSIARLLREELGQQINDAACGGTHRLMGISFAVQTRRNQGLEFDDLWIAAEKYIYDYQEYAFSLQNPDGSFSTDWFKGPGNDKSAKRRLYTTGHILEWLAFSLPEEQLSDSRLTRSVDYLTNLMLGAPGYQLDVGPCGHAVRALRLYQERVVGQSNFAELLPEDGSRNGVHPVTVATHPEQGAARTNNAPFSGTLPLRRSGFGGWRR